MRSDHPCGWAAAADGTKFTVWPWGPSVPLWVARGFDPGVSKDSSSAICDPVSGTHPDLRGRGCGAEVYLLAAPRHEDTLADHTSLNANPTDNVQISPNGSVITIVGTRPSNHGAYRCVASNAYGVAQSVVNLSVHGEGRQPHGLCLSLSSPDSKLRTSRVQSCL